MSTLADAPYQVSVSFVQGSKAVAAAGTPERLVAVDTYVEFLEIHARKAPATANTGAVYLGFSPTGGQNFRVMLPGDPGHTYRATLKKKLNLKDFYVDAATNADAVTYTAGN